HQIHVHAFDNRIGEAALVALLRVREHYDPELSLIATEGEQILGHAMFNPIQVYLNGEIINAVNLAPLAVHPAYQQQGIGIHLMELGHKIAQEKGYSFSLLLGHSTYYPRFGYQTHAYSASSLEVATSTLPDIAFETAKPIPNDIPALAELHRIN